MDARTYTFDVTPDGDGTVSGNVVVSVAAGSATDAAGNTSVASNTLSVTFDGSAPDVAADSLTTFGDTRLSAQFDRIYDKIVPPEQSLRMAEKLKTRGIEVAYHAFAGEGHGFRMARTITAVLEAELDFLRRVLRLG